ncbi:MAG TPA: hypothetical protein VMH39_09835, partial [Gemmatimonadaceae bacterium]|nr:hypothetical protein [Gemmatimonadaceae bacterium]
GVTHQARSVDADGYVWTSFATDPIPGMDAWALLSDGTAAVVRTSDYRIEWFGPDGVHTTSPPVAHEWHRLTDSAKAALLDSVHTQRLARPGVQTGRTADGRAKTRPWTPDLIPAEELRDYLPPFSGATVDAQNNLWICESYAAMDMGLVYDIVNRSGKLIDRVRIPGGTTIAGFGPGVVYLQSREGRHGSLARARMQ